MARAILCRAIAFAAALAPLSAAAEQARVVKSLPGCAARTTMERVLALVDEKDGAAADALITAGIASGACRDFEAGALVVVESRDALGDLALIRMPGDPDSFWVMKFILR
jgi:hypothetical protein